MPRVQLVLAIDIPEGLVIRMEHKRLRFEVMTPMSQGPDYSIKFLVIGAVVTPRTVEFLTEISKGPPGLNQDSSNPYSTSITLNLKQIVKVR